MRRAGGPRARRRSTTTAPGKHAGFLAVCQARGWETAGYRPRRPPAAAGRSWTRWPVSPVLASEDLPTAIDGCGVVTFAISLERMAARVRPAARDRRRRADARRHARAPGARRRRGLARHRSHVRRARLGGERRRRGPALRNRAGRHRLRPEVRGRQPSPAAGGARAVSSRSISVLCSSRAHAARSSAMVERRPGGRARPTREAGQGAWVRRRDGSTADRDRRLRLGVAGAVRARGRASASGARRPGRPGRARGLDVGAESPREADHRHRARGGRRR